MEIVFLIGRIILGGYFIFSGVNHFRQVEAMGQYTGYKGVPAPKLAVIVTGLLLLSGGLMILVGYQLVIAAGLLVLFLVPTTLVMHNFWTQADQMAKMNDMAHFLKNSALVGAVLALAGVPAPWPYSF